jgi:hypothetical protein
LEAQVKENDGLKNEENLIASEGESEWLKQLEDRKCSECGGKRVTEDFTGKSQAFIDWCNAKSTELGWKVGAEGPSNCVDCAKELKPSSGEKPLLSIPATEQKPID